MGNRYVVLTDRGWRVMKENAQRPSATADTQADAVERAIQIVSKDGGGQVIVHGKDGQIHATHDVKAGSSASEAPATADAAPVQSPAATSTTTASQAAVAADQAVDKAVQPDKAAVQADKGAVQKAVQADKAAVQARKAVQADKAADAVRSAAKGTQTDSAASATHSGLRRPGEHTDPTIASTLQRLGGLVKGAGKQAFGALQSARNALKRRN